MICLQFEARIYLIMLFYYSDDNNILQTLIQTRLSFH